MGKTSDEILTEAAASSPKENKTEESKISVTIAVGFNNKTWEEYTVPIDKGDYLKQDSLDQSKIAESAFNQLPAETVAGWTDTVAFYSFLYCCLEGVVHANVSKSSDATTSKHS